MRTDLDFAQFRTALETQNSVIQQRLELERKALHAYSDGTPDFLDAATKLVAQEQKVGTINYLKARQKQIEAALLRLDSGKFGLCARCGQDIQLDRLKAKPHAKYCIGCQKKVEHSQR